MPFPERSELLMATLGGFLGIFSCALLAGLTSKLGLPSLFLVAPLGATAVLVFAVPNSPLAQPWSAVLGNTLAAICGVIAVTLASPQVAPVFAVTLAFAAMLLGRALHPPGGAVALLMGLSPDLVYDNGILGICLNISLMTLALAAAGVLFHKFSGRRYPFRTTLSQVAPTPPQRLGLDKDELTELLTKFHQTTNLGAVDLARLLVAAEEEMLHHTFEGQACGDAASSDIPVVSAKSGLREIVRRFRLSDHAVLAVTDIQGKFLGFIWHKDVLSEMEKLTRPRLLSLQVRATDILRRPDFALDSGVPLGEAITLLVQTEREFLPVTENGNFKGVLTRSGLLNLILFASKRKAAA
jgi:CBS domain-containing membrane protein